MSAVTATYTNAAGDPASGTVYLSPVARAGTDDPAIITEKRVWADLDVDGSISIDVLASDDPSWLTEESVPYLVEERLTHVPFRSYWVVVPTAGLNLADAQPLDPDDIRVVPVLAPGPPGPQGEAGPQGPQGDPGQDGVDGQDFTPTDADARYVNADGDTMSGPLIVPAPAAAQQVPRLARTPNPATGDLGLPGYAGSDTGWRDVSADLRTGWTGTLYVRRLGAQIVVRGVLDASAATSNQPWSLAPGFRTITTLVPIGQGVPAGIDGINHVAAGDDGGRSRIILAGGYLTVFRVGQSVGDFVAQWISDDDWPSNLPGTQVTAPATWT